MKGKQWKLLYGEFCVSRLQLVKKKVDFLFGAVNPLSYTTS
jgi:hypothetical protein